MDNSLVTFLTGYVYAMFKDVAYAYTHRSEWKRDQTRLVHELGVHGPRVLTIDLPAICKVLDRSLDEGLLLVDSSVATRYTGLNSHGHPKFFGELWLKIFSTDGKLRDAPCLDAITALRFLLLSSKKLELNCKKESVDEEVRNFFTIENTSRLPTNSWSEDICYFDQDSIAFGDNLDLGDGQCWLPGLGPTEGPGGCNLEILQRVCDRISTQFGDLHEERDHELPKHGPGAVANQRRGESKFLFREWPAKLDALFPYDRYATTNLGQDIDTGGEVEWGLNKESPSRLISVPKTMKSPRLIAAEPNQHQWIQQLVKNQLEERIVHTSLAPCVRFRSQAQNQQWAIRGSLDGKVATIDLSSASDRLSCWTVERAFRKNPTILRRLHACRTRWISNEVSSQSERYLLLRKLAPQGSAVTFPVQSIVYAMVSIAAVISARRWRVTKATIDKASRLVSVFGDDMIVPSDCMGVLVDSLSFLGLKVNVSKSFGTGKFRESCGVDAFRGIDITPPYLRRFSTKVQMKESSSFVKVVNNYFLKGYWNCSEFLLDKFAFDRNLIPIVAASSSYPGLASFCGASVSSLRKRWNKDLQVEECRLVLPTNKTRLLETKGGHRLFQWFIEKPPADSQWESGTRDRPVVTSRPGWTPIRDIMAA